jgi:PAS domain S-box-containing protein
LDNYNRSAKFKSRISRKYHDRLTGPSPHQPDHRFLNLRSFMGDHEKTQSDLIREIEELRRRVTELEALEEQRRKSETPRPELEEKSRAILENIEDGYYEVDLSGKYILCNRAYAEILGTTRDQIIGRTYKEIGAPDHQKTHQIFNTVFRTGVPAKLVYRRVTRRDGAQKEIEYSVSLVRDEKGSPVGFRGIVRDATERKLAEDHLKELNSLLEATFESTADGILVVDGQGRIIRFNNKFVELWGIPDSILESRDDNQALAYVLAQLKDPDEFLKKVTELYAHPDEESFDTIEFKNGRVFERYSIPQRIDGKTIGRVWSFRDITARLQAEEDLKESEERYRITVEYSNDGIGLVRGKWHIYANQKFVEIFGYDRPEEIIGKPISLTLHPDDLERVTEINQRRQRGEPAPEKYEFKGIRKDGQPVFIEISARKIIYKGEPVSLVFIRDVTDRKKAEEQLRNLSLADDLTGLYNRRGFLTLAEQELKMANRLKRGMFLLFADLDHLKEINDRFGHQEGDRALMDVTHVIKETFRDPDIIARIGGDEFVILAI